MAKEFKERKIKNDNKKYIKIGTVVALAIIMLTLIIVIIIKCSKPKKSENNSSSNIQENSEVNMTDNTNSELIPKTNLNIIPDNNIIKNEVINPNNENVPKENVENNLNQIETELGKKFISADAIISGIQREMTEEQVEALRGKPESVQNEREIATDYVVQKYYYNNKKTEIDFIALYQKDKFIVHRIKTSNSGETLARGLKLGSTVEEVLAAYSQESILYKDDSLIVIGHVGEDPRYATSIKPKLYLDIEKGVIVGASVSIGSEI